MILYTLNQRESSHRGRWPTRPTNLGVDLGAIARYEIAPTMSSEEQLGSVVAALAHLAQLIVRPFIEHSRAKSHGIISRSARLSSLIRLSCTSPSTKRERERVCVIPHEADVYTERTMYGSTVEADKDAVRHAGPCRVLAATIKAYLHTHEIYEMAIRMSISETERAPSSTRSLPCSRAWRTAS